jgi:hypothetical protein
MGNRAKSLFCSVLFNKFHHKIKLIAFYLPHMEYEGSFGFVSTKMKIFIADFHVLGLFMA